MKRRVVALAASTVLGAALVVPGAILFPQSASANRLSACAHLNVAFNIVEEHGGNTQGIEDTQFRICAP